MLTNSILGDLKYYLRYGNVVVKLIIANTVLFLLFVVASIIIDKTWSSQWLISYLGTPANVIALAAKPWTLITYMFVHGGIIHLLLNMLGLYWFGEIFVLYLGEQKVLPLYLLGGLAGALFYLGGINLIPAYQYLKPSAVLVGASGSIFAIMFAAVALNAEHKVNLSLFGEVKIVWVAVIALAIGVINMLVGNNVGGGLAHIGGSLFGYVYVKSLHGGVDVFKPFTAAKGLFKPKRNVKITYKSAHPQVGKASRSSNEQERIDAILDKISRSGYDSLTKEERDFLFDYSNK